MERFDHYFHYQEQIDNLKMKLWRTTMELQKFKNRAREAEKEQETLKLKIRELEIKHAKQVKELLQLLQTANQKTEELQKLLNKPAVSPPPANNYEQQNDEEPINLSEVDSWFSPPEETDSSEPPTDLSTVPPPTPQFDEQPINLLNLDDLPPDELSGLELWFSPGETHDCSHDFTGTPCAVHNELLPSTLSAAKKSSSSLGKNNHQSNSSVAIDSKDLSNTNKRTVSNEAYVHNDSRSRVQAVMEADSDPLETLPVSGSLSRIMPSLAFENLDPDERWTNFVQNVPTFNSQPPVSVTQKTDVNLTWRQAVYASSSNPQHSNTWKATAGSKRSAKRAFDADATPSYEQMNKRRHIIELD